MKRHFRIALFFAFGFVIVVMVSAGPLHAWDRSWRFVNPSFNPVSLSGAYLQFTADASGGGAGQPDFEIPDIEGALDNAFDNIENIFFDVQSGTGNVRIDFPSTDTPDVPDIPNF